MDVKVKLCGLTNLADAQAALAAGADLLGFIFFPKSPRYVTPEQVRDILAGLEPQGQVAQASVLTVGVFVNESPQAMAQILDFCGLDLAQLHGEEPPAMLGLDDDSAEALEADRSLMRGRAYKALRPRSPEEAGDLARRYALPSDLQAGGHLPAFLLDAYHPQLRGGTGEMGDWELAASLAAWYPLLLAGGLTPANVTQAVRAVRPWGVDVSSGVEKSPGQKDHAALRAFIAAAKQMAVSREGIASDR
jgi:phosphoribosylanthranilate isomerase